MLRPRHVMSVMVVAVLATAGCGGGSDDIAGDGGTAPTTAPAPTGPPTDPPPETPAADAPVPEALAFQAATVDGGELDASTLAGEPVAFWFWASWCSRCAAFASDLKEVQAEYEGRVHVVGVAGLGSGEAGMRDFVDQHGLDAFPHLADDDGQVWVRFGVNSQEYMVILDAAGEIVHEGPVSAQGLRDQLASVAG